MSPKGVANRYSHTQLQATISYINTHAYRHAEQCKQMSEHQIFQCLQGNKFSPQKTNHKSWPTSKSPKLRLQLHGMASKARRNTQSDRATTQHLNSQQSQVWVVIAFHQPHISTEEWVSHTRLHIWTYKPVNKLFPELSQRSCVLSCPNASFWREQRSRLMTQSRSFHTSHTRTCTQQTADQQTSQYTIQNIYT